MFEGQYNDAHKEIEIEYSVKLNFVLPHNKRINVSEEDVDKWFRKNLTALQTGIQLNYGNGMQQITIEKK